MIRRTSFPTSSLFDDFLTKDLFDWSGRTDNARTLPRVNILETNNDFRVEMAAPGLRKEDFQVSLDNDMLTIQSEMQENLEENNEVKVTRREFGYDSFKRSFHLPNTVEADKIEARYRDGILSLVIPKKEEARKKPVKSIAIS